MLGGDVGKLSLSHLGTLYVLDEGKNGSFTESDLTHFADLCAARESHYMQNEFSTMMQAYCTLTLWEDVTTPSGQKVFVDWFLSLFSSDEEVAILGSNGVTHITKEGLSTLHLILSVEKGYGLPLDEFFDLMRNASEADGNLDPEIQDAVSLSILARFASSFIKGFASMMDGLGFDSTESYCVEHQT